MQVPHKAILAIQNPKGSKFLSVPVCVCIDLKSEINYLDIDVTNSTSIIYIIRDINNIYEKKSVVVYL